MQPIPPTTGLPKPDEPDAPPPAYSETGVDLTLIRWMLSLTPTERLDVLEEHVRFLSELKNGRFTD